MISGRALADVKQLVGIDKIVYMGNHGFEIEGEALDFGDFSFERFREILEYLKWEINKELIFFKGAFIEDKGIGLSVHYRMLNQKEESIFKIFLESITQEFLLKNKIHVLQGKKVFETKPPVDWDKGKAALWLLKTHADALNNQKAVTIYIGDDQTDEDAFEALSKIATTIHVGKTQSTSAQYYLETPQEVAKFLGDLQNLI